MKSNYYFKILDNLFINNSINTKFKAWLSMKNLSLFNENEGKTIIFDNNFENLDLLFCVTKAVLHLFFNEFSIDSLIIVVKADNEK